MAIVGDFCLDRYLEIDSSKQEVSIETGLPVFNVTNVRALPGGGGTILNNLVALGVGEIMPIGFAGHDAEGWLLTNALKELRGVNLDYFVQTKHRQTFTYMKPMLSCNLEQASKERPSSEVPPATIPREWNRFDFKNWTPTPGSVEDSIVAAITRAARDADAIILLDQVDIPGTGVITDRVLDTVAQITTEEPIKLTIADSRSGLHRFPPMLFKMNRDELTRLVGLPAGGLSDQTTLLDHATQLAVKNGHPVVVTLSEQGMLSVDPSGGVVTQAALPVRGEIDIVGAGDAVTANLAVTLASGAAMGEAIHAATAAASIVVHQLGTTGVATPEQIVSLLERS